MGGSWGRPHDDLEAICPVPFVIVGMAVGLIGNRSFLWICGVAWRYALGGVDDQECDCVAGRAKRNLDAGELPYDAVVSAALGVMRPLSDAFCVGLVATTVAGLTRSAPSLR